MIEAASLGRLDGIRHGFLTRQGGVSDGLFASLNCGFGSGDEPARVAENRARAMARLAMPADSVATARQVHGRAIAVVERPWPRHEAPEADGLVSRSPGVTLGILTADCGPVLLADPQAQVVGALHCGWKGALGGVIESGLAAMADLGARRERTVAAVGPCIAQPSYEVGPEFRRTFIEAAEANAAYFVPSDRADHWRFDLAGYVAARLREAGVGTVESLALDTAADEDTFFSYRRATLRREPRYGRQLSAIAVAG